MRRDLEDGDSSEKDCHPQVKEIPVPRADKTGSTEREGRLAAWKSGHKDHRKMLIQSLSKIL